MRDTVTTELARAFDNELADAVTEFTGQRVGDSTYDPVTGKYTRDGTLTYYGRGVLTRFSRRDAEFYGVPRSDRKLMVLQNEVIGENGSQVVPQVGDKISGMKVKDVDQDPVDATYEIQLEGPA